MTALELLVPYTTANSQKRGWDYRDLVDVVSGSADAVRAKVRGTGIYDTRLRRDGQNLRVWCTCPYFNDRGSACKHLWATAARADENGWLSSFDRDARVLMDLKDLEDYELTPVSPGAGASWNPVPRYQPTPAPPGWEVALNSVKPKPPGQVAASPESQLLYVFTVPPRATVMELPLAVEKRDQKRDGNWSKPQPARLTFGSIAYLPDPDDRWALALVHSTSAIPREPGVYGYGYATQPLPVEYVKAPMLDMLLHRLCGTGRVRLRVRRNTIERPNQPVDEDLTLEWEPGEPWTFELIVQREPDSYRIDAVLHRGDRHQPVHDFTLVTDSIVVLGNVAAPFDPAGGFEWARQLRSRGVIHIPISSRRELIDSIAASGVQNIRLPDDLKWEERRVEPRFHAVISAPDRWDYCGIEIEAEYEGSRTRIDGGIRLVSEDGSVVYTRDRTAEQAALFLLRRHGATETGVAARKLPALVTALLSHGWNVEAQGVRYRSLRAPRLRIKSGIDWFELDVQDDAGETSIDLAEILKAIRSGSRTVTLGDGTVGMLPEEWLARVAPVLALGDQMSGAMRFKPSQVALLDALLAAQPAVDWDEEFARVRERMQTFAGIHAEDAPPTFNGTLRDYQREALGWMRFLREFGFGGCLADDMGLGKTVMVLAMLEARRTDPGRPHRPSVVVLPRSLLVNWTNEAARFAPSLKVLDFAHADRHAALDAIADADLVLMTYGTLRRDVPALQDFRFDYVILDEAQAIKNPLTATAKAVRLLRADHRLALTGTPIENHLGDLQSLFDFLNPGLFGRAGGNVLDVRRLPASTDERAHVERLAKGLRPFFLRRTKEQVAPELPARTEETLYCELEGEQQRIYRELRDHYRRVLLKQVERDGIVKARMQILEALLRLRQAACHTALVRRSPHASRAAHEGASAKFDVLVPRLIELMEEGRKALVFSQFTSLLALLRARLDADGIAYEYLDGATRNRAERVARFQEDPSCGLFLISLKAGGVGLNLTAAEYVFLLDPWWNPAVEMQAIDRTHRIGQVKPVFAYRLVACDTVEERILELQSRKRALADAILETGAGGLRGLQREDLELLLA
jgi:superfamily II DNA or RNA helicase